jgi:hypothetical protein
LQNASRIYNKSHQHQRSQPSLKKTSFATHKLFSDRPVFFRIKVLFSQQRQQQNARSSRPQSSTTHSGRNGNNASRLRDEPGRFPVPRSVFDHVWHLEIIGNPELVDPHEDKVASLGISATIIRVRDASGN